MNSFEGAQVKSTNVYSPRESTKRIKNVDWDGKALAAIM
jgi:hypothetical protein